MKIILTEKVTSLGNVGEIVNVSPGYARNYLIPKALGVIADENNKKQLAHHKKILASKVAEGRKEAEGVAKKIGAMELEFTRKVGVNGKIFGNITPSQLSRELDDRGIVIEKRSIILDKPIKTLGSFKARLRLFEGVEAELAVKVVMDPVQAAEQKKADSSSEAKKNQKTENSKDTEEDGGETKDA